jgi:uncharacterized membrane protein YadS
MVISALAFLMARVPVLTSVGMSPAAIVADLFIVSSTILVGWWVGYRWLRMDRDMVLLGGGLANWLIQRAFSSAPAFAP